MEHHVSTRKSQCIEIAQQTRKSKVPNDLLNLQET